MFHPAIFSTPCYNDIPSITVYDTCITGNCSCVHFVGDLASDLKPCRAAPFLFGDNALPSVTPDDRDYLWRGFVMGFDVVDKDCNTSYLCQNYDSITSPEFYDEMTTLLTQELAEGKVSLSNEQPQCVHSLGAVRKSNGKLRPITDCSRPDNISINNFMETTFKSFTYNSVEDAVQILDKDDYMAVVDVSSAYRSVNISADQTKFQGLSWDFGQGPVWLVDHRLCFGLRCAPNIYNAISDFVVKIAMSWGARKIVNYLDDFLIISDDASSCLHDRSLVTSAIELLGASVSWKKVTDPCQVTTFLGITIDSSGMELSLPIAKVEKLQDFITALVKKGSATKKDLERVGGLVSHCSYVVRGGRTFSRRIFDLAASYSRNSRCIPLDDNIKADLKWWLAFCASFNGRACIIKDLHPIPLYSDASFLGFGAWMGLDWFYGHWAPDHCSTTIPPGCGHLLDPPKFEETPKNINVYELWPVILGVHRWAPHFRNSRMHIVTDNMQVLAMINTGRSSNKLCMSWLRELFWTCFINNTDVHASYIKSEDNVLADALSRSGYRGIPSKCSELLLTYNMCCSSPHSAIDGPHPQEAEDPPRSSPSCIHQEV